MATCATKGCKKRTSEVMGGGTHCSSCGMERRFSKDPVIKAQNAERAELTFEKFHQMQQGRSNEKSAYAHHELDELAEAHAEEIGRRQKAFRDGQGE